MWLIDHMTSISEDGIGKVLGGRPIKYEEDIKPELGISQDTYTRWTEKLLEYPYIETTLAPYGIIFRVLKAKKRFRTNAESEKGGSAEVRKVRGSAQMRNVIRQDSLNSTKNTSAAGASLVEVHRFFNLFKGINPSVAKFYSNKTQITSAKALLKMKPFDFWAGWLAQYFVQIRTDKYCPRATTPWQLEERLGDISAHISSTKVGELTGNGRGRGFEV